MPCKKFISLRLEPGQPTRVYVDKMTVPKLTLPALGRFQLASPPTTDQTSAGTALRIDPMRWPPQGYDSPISFALSAQWPFGTKLYEANDTAGPEGGRSFASLEFVYDKNAKRLSWNQSNPGAPGKMQGSIEFNRTTPVWYVTLTLNPKAPKSKGQLLVNGQDIS